MRVAWLIVLLASAVPAIAFTELTGQAPSWLLPGQIGLLAVAFLAGTVRPALRELRELIVVLLALLLLLEAADHVDFTSRPLQSLFGATAFDERMQAEQTAKLAIALGMIGVLRLLGHRRRECFLTTGDLRAPLRPVRLLGFPRPEPWWRFGLQWSVYIAVVLAAGYYLSRRPSGDDLSSVVTMLPSILFYAGLNSFNEELTYRSPMLVTLEPAVGSVNAVWRSAVFFGAAHYAGMGLAGAFASVFMGWILGKAMVETRGLFWAWWIHFLADIAIFTFLAATLV